MKWYSYDQTNSGGEWRGPKVVHIEADDAAAADRRALAIGIYFDGCALGRDCGCCGDRWYPAGEHRSSAERPAVPDDKPIEIDGRKLLALSFMSAGMQVLYVAADGIQTRETINPERERSRWAERQLASGSLDLDAPKLGARVAIPDGMKPARGMVITSVDEASGTMTISEG